MKRLHLVPAATFGLAFLLLCFALDPLVAFAIELPADFVAEDVAPGAGFVVPVSIAFMPDGRLMVGEKQGRVWIVKNGVKYPIPMWEHESEVLDDGDRGLLAVACDPNYATNHFVYFMYTVDPDSDNVDTNSDAYGRLVRFQTSAADSNVVDLTTRAVLFGRTWAEGPTIGSITHTVGSLRWGRDGSLLASTGDGAQFDYADYGGRDPEMFVPGAADPYEDIGAFRSQYLGSMDGKILRIDPMTGHGYPSNPFWDGNPMSVRSRVWTYGLRNPYRFTVRPGTGNTNPANGAPGTLYVGDVGWAQWEEADIIKQPGMNMGWPCYEGFGPNADYHATTPSHMGCDSIGNNYWNPNPVSPPLIAWNHSDENASIPPGFRGNTSIGGAFYTGNRYPVEYRGKYFFMDYGANFMRVLDMSPTDSLIDILPFGLDMEGPVDLAVNPLDGDLTYVSIWAFEVRRIRYTGPGSGNLNPIARAAGAPLSGPPPLLVNFSSAGSYDPDGNPMSIVWTFGDGTGSTSPNPSHTYGTSGTYTAILELNDGVGGIGRDTVLVYAGTGSMFPTTPIVDTFDRANGPIGGAWTGNTTGLVIVDSTLTSSGGYATTIWNGAVFDTTQEAYFTLRQKTVGSPEHDLMLKAQGLTYDQGHIEVRYDDSNHTVLVSTFTPGPGWETRGGPYSLTLNDGDQFGARAHGDGRVDVFVNGQLFTTANVDGWPFATLGGRIGLTLDNVVTSKIDDFGGGNFSTNTPPVASIPGVVDSSFYVAGDTLTFIGAKSDAQDPPSALLGHWSTRLVHNNHFHILAETDGDTTEVLTENHDDGTGVYLLLRYIVTDTGSLKDTATVHLFPENDLEPSAVTVLPSEPRTGSASRYSFWIRNHGRLPARISQWRLTANATTLAQGDTVVAALDSVEVIRTLPPGLTAGTYDLRATVDTLGVVVETNESNNGHTQSLTVVNGTLDVGDAPLSVMLSNAFPNPTATGMSLSLELPTATTVAFSVHDLQGRAVWRAPEQTFAAGHQSLRWNGRNMTGAPVAPGLYLARVKIGGDEQVRRFAVLR